MKIYAPVGHYANPVPKTCQVELRELLRGPVHFWPRPSVAPIPLTGGFQPVGSKLVTPTTSVIRRRPCPTPPLENPQAMYVDKQSGNSAPQRTSYDNLTQITDLGD